MRCAIASRAEDSYLRRQWKQADRRRTRQNIQACPLGELAFWSDASQLTKSLFPTMNAPDGFYVMISTPNGRNDPWHNLWKKAEAGRSTGFPIYIPFYRRADTYSLPILKPKSSFSMKMRKLFASQVLKKESYSH